MALKLDAIDRRILRALQRDGRLQNLELANEVGLSPSPCLRRVRLLEERGIIEKYVAILDPVKIDMTLTLFVRVWLTGQDEETANIFVNGIKDVPEVMECHLMAGDCDFLLRVVTSDVESYRKFQREYFTRIKGVQNVKTEIPLQKIKLTSELPV